jgi:hypothetical protein
MRRFSRATLAATKIFARAFYRFPTFGTGSGYLVLEEFQDKAAV